jgi:hypothetical protein
MDSLIEDGKHANVTHSYNAMQLCKRAETREKMGRGYQEFIDLLNYEHCGTAVIGK